MYSEVRYRLTWHNILPVPEISTESNQQAQAHHRPHTPVDQDGYRHPVILPKPLNTTDWPHPSYTVPLLSGQSISLVRV